MPGRWPVLATAHQLRQKSPGRWPSEAFPFSHSSPGLPRVDPLLCFGASEQSGVNLGSCLRQQAGNQESCLGPKASRVIFGLVPLSVSVLRRGKPGQKSCQVNSRDLSRQAGSRSDLKAQSKHQPGVFPKRWFTTDRLPSVVGLGLPLPHRTSRSAGQKLAGNEAGLDCPRISCALCLHCGRKGGLLV